MGTFFNNIIVISIDALRFDCVTYQQHKLISKSLLSKYLHTPILDKIKKNSICFQNAYSSSSYTTPAHASLFTGLYPYEHNIRPIFYSNERLTGNCKTLAEFYRKKNFSTFFFSDNAIIFKHLDLTRGFETISDRDSQLFQLLDKKRKLNNFLFLHFFDVHSPYLFSPSDCFIDNSDYYLEMEKLAKKFNIKLNDPFWNRKPFELWNRIINENDLTNRKKILLPLYLKGVSKFDKGRLALYLEKITALFDMSKTVIIFLSDHGEGNLSPKLSNSFGHAMHLSQDVIRIPVMIYSPKFKHQKINYLISIKDIYSLIKSFSNKPFNADNILNNIHKKKYVYAESWLGKTENTFTNIEKALKENLIKKKKKDYYLYERGIFSRTLQFVVYYTPEKFIKIIDKKFNKDYLKNLMINVFYNGIWPSKPLRYFFYIASLFFPKASKKNILNFIFKMNLKRISIYLCNKRNTKNNLRNNFLLFFKIIGENLSKEKVYQFIDLIWE